MEQNESFEYTYSAPEQEEIRSIREKYLPPDQRETKMEELRRLDASVTKKGTVAAVTLGVISCLVMGAGMSLCLVWMAMVPGILVGVTGMAGMAAAYPMYLHITQAERRRIAPRILELTDELMQS